jgi:hypothetical protein
MSDPTMDNLVLERLREIRGLLGEVKEDTADTRLRVGMLEAGYASVSLRLDRLAADVERVKRHLDLVDTPG